MGMSGYERMSWDLRRGSEPGRGGALKSENKENAGGSAEGAPYLSGMLKD